MGANVSKLSDKHVVIGLGKTGLSCVRFLKRLECDVVAIDTRQQPPGMEQLQQEFPDVPLLTGPLKNFNLTTAQELIVSPGVSIQEAAILEARAAGVSIAGDIELFARSVATPMIAVTGSNGKSTVVTLLGKALESLGYDVCVAGNIGLPVLDALISCKDVDVWVLELSSFQLETTDNLCAKVAVNLNVSDDHMDRYQSMADYATAKQRIFDCCEAAVYWIEDPRTKPMQALANTSPFGSGKGARGRFHVGLDNDIRCVKDGSKTVVYESDLRIKGEHNLLNVAAVLTTLVEFGVDYKLALPAIKAFPGLPHRCQWVAKVNGVDWYNDSKGTNVGSATAAINGLSVADSANLFWIAGGDSKGAELETLRQPISEHVATAILFGQDADKLRLAIEDVVATEQVETLDQAVASAFALANGGDVVLFSPACASFDQFENYEARGRRFVELVGGLVS